MSGKWTTKVAASTFTHSPSMLMKHEAPGCSWGRLGQQDVQEGT